MTTGRPHPTTKDSREGSRTEEVTRRFDQIEITAGRNRSVRPTRTAETRGEFSPPRGENEGRETASEIAYTREGVRDI